MAHSLRNVSETLVRVATLRPQRAVLSVSPVQKHHIAHNGWKMDSGKIYSAG